MRYSNSGVTDRDGSFEATSTPPPPVMRSDRAAAEPYAGGMTRALGLGLLALVLGTTLIAYGRHLV